MSGFNKMFPFIKNKEECLLQPEQHRLGSENSGKIVYLIEEDKSDIGFFAMYRQWVEYLYFAHICGYFPVIKAGEHFAYRDMNGIKQTDNVFEYYFKQPVGIRTQDAYKSNRVIFSEIGHRKMVELVLLGKYNCYFYNKRYLYMMSDIIRKYVKFNQCTWDYISNGINLLRLSSYKVLGIHMRGSDFRKKFNNHPVLVSEEEMFEKIDFLMPRYGYEKIFLATDDEIIFKSFDARYHDQMLTYTDVIRSTNRQSVAFQKNNRINHPYLLGLEVIRDMYTLSLCDGLICGISQVAICAQMNKLARREKYQNIEVVDHGIYKNNRNFHR